MTNEISSSRYVKLSDVTSFEDLTRTKEAQTKSKQHFRSQLDPKAPKGKQALYTHTGLSSWFGLGNTKQRQAKWKAGASKIKKLINDRYDPKFGSSRPDRSQPGLARRIGNAIGAGVNKVTRFFSKEARRQHRQEHREQIREKYFSNFADQLFKRINDDQDKDVRYHFGGRDLNKEILGKDIKYIESQANILRRELNRKELLENFATGKYNATIDNVCQQGSEKVPREQFPKTWDHLADNLKAGASKLAELKDKHPNDWQKILDGDDDKLKSLTKIDIANMKMASDVLTLALANAKTQKLDEVDLAKAIKDYMGNPTNRGRLAGDVNNETTYNFGKNDNTYVENLQGSVDLWAEHLGNESGDISPNDVQWLKNQLKNWDNPHSSDKNDLHLGGDRMGDMLEEMSARFGAETTAYQDRSGNKHTYLMQAKVMGSDGQPREAAAHRKLPRKDDEFKTVDVSSIKSEVDEVSNLTKIGKLATRTPREVSSKDIALWHGPYFRQMIALRHEHLAKNNPDEKGLQGHLEALPALKTFVNEQSHRGNNPDLGVGKVKTPEQFMEKWINGNDLAKHTSFHEDEISNELSAIGRFSGLRHHLETVTGGHYKGVELDGLKTLSTLSGKDLVNVQNEAASIKKDLARMRDLADEFDFAANSNETSSTDKAKLATARDVLRASAKEMEKELEPLTKLRDSWVNQGPKESLMRHSALLYYRDKHLCGHNATGAQVVNIALANSHHKFDAKLVDAWSSQRHVLDDFSTFLNTKGGRLRELEIKRTKESLNNEETSEFEGLRRDLKELEKECRKFKTMTDDLRNSGKNLAEPEEELFAALAKTFEDMEKYFGGERVEVAKSARSLFQRQAHIHSFTDSRVGVDFNLTRMDRDRTILNALQTEMLLKSESQSALAQAESPGDQFAALPSPVNVRADEDAIEDFEEFEYRFRSKLQADPEARNRDNLSRANEDIQELKRNIAQLESSSKRLKAMRSVIDDGKFDGKLTANYYWKDDKKTKVDDNNHRAEYTRIIDQYTGQIDKIRNTMEQRLEDYQKYVAQSNT